MTGSRRKRSFPVALYQRLRQPLQSVGSLEHMLMFSWLAATVGVVLFHVALTLTLHANPATRIPFYRNAKMVPAGSVALRATGAGLIVFGAAMLSTSAWYWPFVIVLAGPIAALIVIIFHNKNVATRATS